MYLLAHDNSKFWEPIHTATLCTLCGGTVHAVLAPEGPLPSTDKHFFIGYSVSPFATCRVRVGGVGERIGASLGCDTVLL